MCHQDIYKKDANVERRDSFSLSHLLRNVIQRGVIVEAIPSKASSVVESKRQEENVEAGDEEESEDLEEGGVAENTDLDTRRDLSYGSEGGSNRRGVIRGDGHNPTADRPVGGHSPKGIRGDGNNPRVIRGGGRNPGGFGKRTGDDLEARGQRSKGGYGKRTGDDLEARGQRGKGGFGGRSIRSLIARAYAAISR